MTAFFENDEKKPDGLWQYFGFILERLYHCFCVLIIEMLKCSDVSWYRDTFDMMHRYSCTLYRPISILQTVAIALS